MRKQESENDPFCAKHVAKRKKVKFIFKVGMSIEDVERGVIAMILDWYNGNKSRTAKILGVSRATLYNKIRKYNISMGATQPTMNSKRIKNIH